MFGLLQRTVNISGRGTEAYVTCAAFKCGNRRYVYGNRFVIQVQLQLLTAIVKLFLKKPTETQELVQQVLSLATQVRIPAIKVFMELQTAEHHPAGKSLVLLLAELLEVQLASI